MHTAVCRRKCTFGGRVWRPGEEYRGEAEPPRHFEAIAPAPVPLPVPEPVPVPEPEPVSVPKPAAKKKSGQKETDGE